MRGYEPKAPRVSRAREAVPQYGTAGPAGAVYDAPLQAPGVYHVTVDERGRVMLPAEIRERLKIRDGDRVAVSIEDDGSVSITTRKVALDQLQGMFKHLAPKDHFASDDIIAERRREARMDDLRNQEWLARRRKKKR